TNLQGSSTFSGTTILDGRTLNNSATVTVMPSLFVSSFAVINNESGAVWDLQNNASMIDNGNSGTFNNAGVFLKSSGTGQSGVQVAFNNNGSASITNGSLSLQRAGTDTGSFTVAGGAGLNFDGGAVSLSVSSSVSGAGSVGFNGATVNVAGAFSPTG